jgi:signal transduction histidine kinase
MGPNLAQVLNTLAHEIRTPLAVSQGYLKLYLDGLLKTADDQRTALQKTRAALGQIATLCVDMGRVSALSEATDPPLTEQVAVSALLASMQTAGELEGAAWHGDVESPALVAATSVKDLTRALTAVARAAFDEARDEPRVFHVDTSAGSTLTLLAGAAGAVDALRPGPGDEKSGPFDLSRGGKGLTLIWASLVLQQHRVQTWNHQDYRASVGFRFPLVQV